MATAEEIVVQLTAQQGELNAGMAEAATTVKTSTDAMSASCQNAIASFGRFESIQKGSITTAEEAAAAQRDINAAMESGAFTAEEVAEKQALVSAAMSKVGQETQAASGALSMFTRNSRTMYSTSALITDAMTGQFSRMRREVAALGNETGIMAKAFQFALTPAGLIAEALIAVGADAYKASQQIDALNRAVLAGGSAAGLSGDQLETQAEKFKTMGFDIGTARDALGAMAGSGRVTQQDMTNAAQASLEYAQITGKSIKEVSGEFAKLGTDGANGFLKLDESMHFLTASQRENMISLQQTGDSAKAVSIGYDALATHGAMAIKELKDNGEAAEGLWSRIGTTIANVNDTVMKGLGVGLTKQDELNKVNQELDYYKQIGVTGTKINELMQQRATLQTQIAEQANKARQASAGIAQGIEADEKGTHGGKHGSSAGSQLEARLQQEEAEQKVSYDRRTEFEMEYWGEILNTAKKGSAEYVAAWKHTQDLQKQVDAQQLAASDKEAEAGKRAAQERAQAEQKASQEIIQEVQQEAKAKLAADEQTTENAHNLATARVAASLQGYKQEAAAGQISMAEMLRDQIDALNQQLAADIQYYQAKAKLAAGDAAEQAKWNAAIVIDQQKTEARMVEVAKQYQSQVNRIYSEVVREKERDDQRMIMSGFREINALIGRQETFKQALQNVGMQILEEEERNIAKSIAHHFASEQAKTAATVTGNAERVAADQVGQAQSLLVQGEAAVKWIMTEAAKAAAGAFNALVSIPYVGPFLAVGASVAAFAAVAALVSSVASAEGGWERVPADGMMTELHKDEMVLPKHVADPIRGMAKSNSASAFGGNIHVHAMDSRSFAQFLKRNPHAIKQALGHGRRNGW